MGENNCSRNGDENSSCRTFEEDVYWTHFKSMRFFLFLSSDFLSQLMIPKKFSENMRYNLPQKVVLKSPGGAAWEVKLVWDKNTLFFGDGWKEFAKAHNFKERDLLMFKYSRDSCFKVWAFNERDSCEIASSYFVRKSVLDKHDVGETSNPKRKKTGENPELEDSETEEASAGASRRKTHRQSVCSLRTSGADAKTPTKPWTLDGGPLSEAGKERALEMASRDCTSDCFKVVMKASNISQYYRLGIPASWARAHLVHENQDMELRANGKGWTVRFNVGNRHGGGVLVSGWYSFVVDNSLQESDVCLFKLVSRKDEPAVFNVLIYRAAPKEVEQPSQTPSSGRY